jgi:hypothetical protein
MSSDQPANPQDPPSLNGDQWAARGRQAFADGMRRLPTGDPQVYAAIAGLPVGGGAAEIMRA